MEDMSSTLPIINHNDENRLVMAFELEATPESPLPRSYKFRPTKKVQRNPIHFTSPHLLQIPAAQAAARKLLAYRIQEQNEEGGMPGGRHAVVTRMLG